MKCREVAHHNDWRAGCRHGFNPCGDRAVEGARPQTDNRLLGAITAIWVVQQRLTALLLASEALHRQWQQVDVIERQRSIALELVIHQAAGHALLVRRVHEVDIRATTAMADAVVGGAEALMELAEAIGQVGHETASRRVRSVRAARMRRGSHSQMCQSGCSTTASADTPSARSKRTR